MIIKTLKLENYRRFSALELEFPENLIGIIGRNGSGKSTLIEAIGWVLYGNRLGRTEKQDIRSQNAPDKSQCSVEMTFNFGDHEYKIVRKLKGKNATSEAAVYRDGNDNPVAVQDRGVDEFIQNLLQLDYNAFTASVFARQKDLDKLSSLSPEERRKSINRLIGIDKIDYARKQVRIDRNNKQQFMNGQVSSLKNIDELKQTLQDIKKSHTTQTETVKAQTDLVEQKTKALAEGKTEFEKLSALREQFIDLDSQLGRTRSSLEGSNEMLSRSQTDLENILQAEKALKELEIQLAPFAEIKAQKEQMDREQLNDTARQSRLKEQMRMQENISREEKRLSEYQEKAQDLKEIEKEIEQLAGQEKQAEVKQKQLQQQLTEVKGSTLAITEQGQKERKKLDQLKEVGPEGKCPLCSQRLGDHLHSVSEEMDQLLKKLRADLVSLRTKEAEIEAGLKETEQSIRKIRGEREQLLKKQQRALEAVDVQNRIQETISSYTQQLELVQKELDQLGDTPYSKDEHEAVKAQYESLLEIKNKTARAEEQVKRKAGVEKDISITDKNIKQLENDIKSLLDRQKNLHFDPTAYNTSKNQVDLQIREADEAKEVLAGSREKLAELKTQLNAIESEIKAQKEIRDNIQTIKEEILYLNALDEHFGTFRSELASRVRPLIAHQASALLALTTHSRYNLMELDNDYNIRIYDGSESFPIGRFSGGEQDLANLCLRIAISQIVAERSGGAPVNFIVLDEIFGSQDSERRDLILTALGQLSTQFRQVFIITHIEPVKDMLPVIIQVDTVNDEYSSALMV